jgi:hypothetical protein
MFGVTLKLVIAFLEGYDAVFYGRHTYTLTFRGFVVSPSTRSKTEGGNIYMLKFSNSIDSNNNFPLKFQQDLHYTEAMECFL